MKVEKNMFLLLAAVTLFTLISSCKVGRFVFYNVADARDYKKFPSRPLKASATPFEFPRAIREKSPKTISIDGHEIPFSKYLSDNGTVAFLIIQNDSIQWEQYYHDYGEKDWVPSFSMAKSFTSLLIGCAIGDGLITSVQDPITKYIPELAKNGFDKVTIEHLLQMTSGLKFNEGYLNPFGEVATFYYGKNLEKATLKLHLKQEPGTGFEYTSGTTQLLGLVLARALKEKTITQYMNEKIWQPLGMQYDASWSIDRKKNGIEKTFCCINATALDFAKIGRLVLRQGNWNGNQLLPADWIATSARPDTTHGGATFYKYQWWLPSGNGDMLANGHLGQFVYVNPQKNLVIVRLGKRGGKVKSWGQLFISLAEQY